MQINPNEPVLNNIPPEGDGGEKKTPVNEKQNTVFAVPNDTDGIVTPDDVKYFKESKFSAIVDIFLYDYRGKPWTEELKAKLDLVLKSFNARERILEEREQAQETNKLGE